jgi:hypothetical protein
MERGQSRHTEQINSAARFAQGHFGPNPTPSA